MMSIVSYMYHTSISLLTLFDSTYRVSNPCRSARIAAVHFSKVPNPLRTFPEELEAHLSALSVNVLLTPCLFLKDNSPVSMAFLLRTHLQTCSRPGASSLSPPP
jgi:hypothetical protein